MWHFVVEWCRSWRRGDVVMTVSACVVMVAGMVALAGHGAFVLVPLLPGVALLWRTPLARDPFDLGPVEPKPHTPPWERDARRREARRAQNNK